MTINTNPYITTQHTIRRGIFVPAIPGLVEEFEQFMRMAYDYLYFQRDDICYHPPATSGRAGYYIVTISNEGWRFSGEFIRENPPYTGTAAIYYHGHKVWEAKQTVLTPSNPINIENKVCFCLSAAAKSYNSETPWRGPQYFTDHNTGLHYKAEYRGNEDDTGFSIEKSISDANGTVVWAAICEGGYV